MALAWVKYHTVFYIQENIFEWGNQRPLVCSRFVNTSVSWGVLKVQEQLLERAAISTRVLTPP